MNTKTDDGRKLLNFDRPSQLLKAGAGMWAHNGDKYRGLKLNVGKTKRTWYFRGRINGEFKSFTIGPLDAYTAVQAMAKLKEKTAHHGNEGTGEIKTVRDAWDHHCATSLSNGKMSEGNREHMTSVLERHASEILKKHPTDVSTIMIQSTVNKIDTGMSENSAATKRHVRVALVAAFKQLDMRNPAEKVDVPKPNERATFWDEACNAYPELDHEDWSIMWGAIMQQHRINVLRGTAWVVMLFTGIREGNVRRLRWIPDGKNGHVDLQREQIKFPKLKSGNRDMVIPISKTVRDALVAIMCDDEWVFPAHSKTGHLDSLDRLSAKIKGEKVPILRPHDTRAHFQSACNEAMLPPHVMSYLRGDRTTKGDAQMLLKYTKRVGRTAPSIVEDVILERIGNVPRFAS